MKRTLMLICFRQQVLDAKTTVEQLAHKHLPRELTEAICTSALEQNILNPRKRRLKKNQN
ncbi:hypothetical protein HPULCUR_003457 [Helicostylum pulchrum]|uniref:Uncharacterized protein n=1 Tax=Helicostylum pulchrum TaxID=562976 RepID=A0ABP9XTG7_9FUNG